MGLNREFFGNLTIIPDFLVTLDLDSVENIGHPFWEVLDPNPDSRQLFDRFNKLFFDGTFTDEQRSKVTLEWIKKRGDLAAQLWPANRKRPMRIEMNEEQLKKVLRKDLIETLIHEMIHAYLSAHDMESPENDYHCENFVRKMNEINAKANLNIATTHDFKKSNERFIWRCRRKCRLMPPFFGFAFLKKYGSIPNYKTQMVMLQGTCVHNFERCKPYNKLKVPNEPKKSNEFKDAVSKWDCISYFLEATKRFVRIKTNHPISQDPQAATEYRFVRIIQYEKSFSMQVEVDNDSSFEEEMQTQTSGPSGSGYLINDYSQRSPSQGYYSSRSSDNDDCTESVNNDNDPSIDGDNDLSESDNCDADPIQNILEDKFFANFNKETETLDQWEDWNTNYADFLEKFNYLIVCMSCNERIDDDKAKIVDHSENCTGLTLEETDNILSMYKWIN